MGNDIIIVRVINPAQQGISAALVTSFKPEVTDIFADLIALLDKVIIVPVVVCKEPTEIA